jgi:inner membrane protein
MPTVFGHALVGAGVVNFAAPLLPPEMVRRTAVAAGIAAMLPDMDVIGLKLGVAYGSELGHRGLTHSLVFAAVSALACSLGAWGRTPHKEKILLLYPLLFLAAASHPLLDMLTNGGLGVALLAPFSWARLFFAVRPVPVSPIGIGPSLPFVMSWEAAFFVPFFIGSILAHKPKRPALRVAGALLGLTGTAGAFLVRLSF